MPSGLPSLAPESADRNPAEQHNGRVSLDQFVVICPYCGEESEIYIEPDVAGSFVQDCEVCCNPWRVRVSGEGDDRCIDVGRADGSE